MQEGDVVRFDYTLWIDGDKKPLDTSLEAVAKEHDIDREGKVYAPLTITLGRQQIIPGLEKHLLGLETGKKDTVTLEPEDAYGVRDPKKLQDLPMAEFRKQKVDPKVGMELNLGNAKGRIIRVAGGRVRVDTNHELAGKKLRYDIEVQGVVSDTKGKVDAVCGYLFPMGGHKVETDTKAKRVVLELPDQAKFDQSWPQHKFRVLSELRGATDLEYDVVIQETYPANPPGYGDEEE